MSTQILGIAAAPGIAMGPVKVVREDERPERRLIESAHVPAELERVDAALKQANDELQTIITDLKQRGSAGEAEIFEGHQLFLQDEELIGSAKTKIQSDLLGAESALDEAMQETVTVIESLDDAYLRERAADIRDVIRRVIRKLTQTGDDVSAAQTAGAPVIWIADELSPSDTANLNPNVTAGFASATGGRTSHSAILARSLGIPAVVGLGEEVLSLKDGTYLIVDGMEGKILVQPTEDQIKEYQTRLEQYKAQNSKFDVFRDQPSVSKDGVHVEIVANIGSPQDAQTASQSGAEGVGLFRTEFVYMGRDTLPSEEEQYQAYAAAVRAFGKDAPVVIRTFDIGGDKELPILELPKEDNPFLGYRAIRICLDRHDLFKTQLRAVLRASVEGNVKIMFPMIAAVSEWRQAKALLEEAKAELASEGIAYNPNLETGIMIEVPGAAMMADRLAKEVDFFSIGTNDLVQYTMAADRMNPKLAYLNDTLHPAVLRLIAQVIRAAAKEGKWVGMCGEMAGQPHAVPILLGLGLHEFSMNSRSVLRTRALIAQLSKTDMSTLAEAVLDMDDPADIRHYVEEQLPLLREFL